MLLQYLRGRAARGFSRDRVLFFEVCAGTVQHKILRLSDLLHCHVCSLCFHGLIWDSWVESFGPGEMELQGNRNEAETHVYFQVGCQHGVTRLPSKILRLILWHDKNVLLLISDWQVALCWRAGWYTKIVSHYFVVILIDIGNNCIICLY